MGSSDEGYDSSQGSGRWSPIGERADDAQNRWDCDDPSVIWDTVLKDRMKGVKKPPPTWVDYHLWHHHHQTTIKNFEFSRLFWDEELSEENPSLLYAGPKTTHMVWYTLQERWCSLRGSSHPESTGVAPLAVIPCQLLCQHLVYAVIGIPSHTFIFDKTSKTFRASSGVCYEGVTPESLSCIFAEYAQSATVFRRLELLCQTFFGRSFTFVDDPIVGAFMTVLRELIHIIRGQVLQNLGEQHLLKLHMKMKRFITSIKFLADLCKISDSGSDRTDSVMSKKVSPNKTVKEGSGSSNHSSLKLKSSKNCNEMPEISVPFTDGLELLGYLFHHLQVPCPPSCEPMLLVLLQAAMIPFFTSLERWVFQGIPSSCVVCVDPIALKSRDSLYWTKAFSMPLVTNSENFPALLSQVLQTALKAGTEICLLKLCESKPSLILRPHAPLKLKFCITLEQLLEVQEDCRQYYESVQKVLSKQQCELAKERERKHSYFLEQKEKAKAAHDEAEFARQEKIQHQLAIKREQQQKVRDDLEKFFQESKELRNSQKKAQKLREKHLDEQYQALQSNEVKRVGELKNAVENFYSQLSDVTNTRDSKYLLQQESETKAFASVKESFDGEDLEEECCPSDSEETEVGDTSESNDCLNASVGDGKEREKQDTEAVSSMSLTSDKTLSTPADVTALPDLPSDGCHLTSITPTESDNGSEVPISNLSKNSDGNLKNFAEKNSNPEGINVNDLFGDAISENLSTIAENKKRCMDPSFFNAANKVNDNSDSSVVVGKCLSKEAFSIRQKVLREEFGITLSADDNANPLIPEVPSADETNANLLRQSSPSANVVDETGLNAENGRGKDIKLDEEGNEITFKAKDVEITDEAMLVEDSSVTTAIECKNAFQKEEKGPHETVRESRASSTDEEKLKMTPVHESHYSELRGQFNSDSGFGNGCKGEKPSLPPLFEVRLAK